MILMSAVEAAARNKKNYLEAKSAFNRRLYAREDRMQWVTHEVWVPGRRAVAFVDWPRGTRLLGQLSRFWRVRRRCSTLSARTVSVEAPAEKVGSRLAA